MKRMLAFFIIIFCLLSFSGCGKMRIVKMDGNAMNPTILHEEKLIMKEVKDELKQGDIIVFEMKTSSRENIQYNVKRVIATQHQIVKIDYAKNSVYVDGKKIDEPYIKEPMVNMGMETRFEVPKNHVFVMGDNRNNSFDSRHESFGYIPVKDVIGVIALKEK